MEASRVVGRAQNFAFYTADGERAERLGRCVDGLGRVDRLSGDAAAISRSAVILKPTIAFIDFARRDAAQGDAAGTFHSAVAGGLEPDAVARTLQRCLPEALLIGVGDADDAAMTLLALRSGVSDFIDLGGDPDAVRAVVARLSERLNASSRRALTIAVASARVGVGASTLSAHLATLALGEGTPLRVALLDLGLPVGDGLLYTNTLTGFDFADAVTGLARLDETLVRTGLPVSPNGVSVLALPGDLARMRTLPQADAVMLVDQLRKYFDVMVIDLGGSGSLDLSASVLNLADARLLLTDQGIASVVSLSDLLPQLDERSVDRASLKLVINRYDESYGMSATQLGQRFALEVAGTIPDRRLALGRAAAVGELLVANRQDPYVRAVQRLMDDARYPEGEAPKQGRGAQQAWTSVSRLWRGKR